MATLEHAGSVPVGPRRAEDSVRRLPVLAWIAGWWLAGRAVIVLTAIAVHRFGPSGWIRHVAHAHALGPLEAWDGRWYRIVADSGYLLVPGRQSDPAFFPPHRFDPAFLRRVGFAGAFWPGPYFWPYAFLDSIS